VQTVRATNAVAAVVLICLFAVIIPCALDLKLKLGHHCHNGTKAPAAERDRALKI